MEKYRKNSYINKVIPYVEMTECDYNDIIHSEKYFKVKQPYIEKVLRKKLNHITFSVDSHPKKLIIRSIALNVFFSFVKIIIEALFNRDKIVLQDLGEIELVTNKFNTKYRGKKNDYARAKNNGYYSMIQITYNSKTKRKTFKYKYPYWVFGKTYKQKLHANEDKGIKY